MNATVLRDKDVLVVGDGDAAAVYVEHLIRSGNRVSLSSREPDLAAMSGTDRDKMRALTVQGKLTLLEGTDVASVAPDGDGVKVAFKKGAADKKFDHVVYALGGTAPLSAIELPDVRFDGDVPVLSEDFETNIDGLFLVGDLAAPAHIGAIVFALNSAEQVVRKLVESGRLHADA